MKPRYRKISRDHLDQDLLELRNHLPAPPPTGWVRAVRTALGMSGDALGRRMGITRAAVAALESSEQSATVKLSTLQRAAEAMGCRLVYAFVPDSSLEQFISDQATTIARRELAEASHTMALEAQAVPGLESSESIARLAGEIRESRRLWNYHNV